MSGFRTLAHGARAFLKAKLLRRGTPLVVGWAITGRCNSRCVYCGLWEGESGDLPTDQVLGVIDQMAAEGTIMLSLTGGAPLLRDDIGEIIDHAHDRKLTVRLNSNGILVGEKIGQLGNLDTLTLSLEGPKEIHDAIRGNGSYDAATGAAGTAAGKGIDVAFATVLTADNLESTDHVLEKASELKTKAIFQPPTELVLGGDREHPLVPSQEAYRAAIDRLIRLKKGGSRVVGNSLACLRHLRSWPTPTPLGCASGWLSCRIQPNGDVVRCSREPFSSAPLNCVKNGFRKAFDGLSPVSCDRCWCAARVELNLAFSWNVSSLWNRIRP